MNEVDLKQLKMLFDFIFNSDRFRISEEFYSKEFGNFKVILKGGDFSIILIKDRGKVMVEIEPNSEEVKFDLMLIRSYLIKSPLEESVSLNQQASFLRKHLSDIDKLFCEDNLSQTLIDLKMLRKIRARKIFPDAFG